MTFQPLQQNSVRTVQFAVVPIPSFMQTRFRMDKCGDINLTVAERRPLARVFCPFFPYPGFGGANQVVIGDIDRLLENYDVELVTWITPQSDIERLRAVPAIDTLPDAVKLIQLEAAAERTQLDRLKRVFSTIFSRYSSTERYFYPQLKQVPLLAFADLEVYHYGFCISWLDKAYFPKATKRVCYFHNIEAHLIRQRAVAEQSFFKKVLLLFNSYKLLKNETRVFSSVHETWFVSANDERFARRTLGCQNGVVVTPRFTRHLQETRRNQRRLRAPNTVYTFGLLGALDFNPNIDSAIFILENVCPKIAAEDLDCRIIIAGKNAPKAVRDLARRYSFVSLPGFVDDIEKFWLSIDCMLVPHVSGSGIRIKMLEALSSGVEVIANEEAAKALPDDFDSTGLTVVPTTDFPSTVLERLIIK